MPEGDTIHRVARTLRPALEGATVTAAEAHPRTGVSAGRMVGRVVRRVEARGKHLLIWLQAGNGEPADRAADLVLQTHLRMTGSWHLYRQGQPWQRPAAQRTVSLETADWVAVCFNAPICALLTAAQVARHPVLSTLGPDLSGEAPDLSEARRRLDAHGSRPLLDVLLDQRVFTGVGNVYKSELCWLHRLHPLTSVGRIDAATRDALLADAARLLARNVAATSSARVTTTAGEPGNLYVYGRGGKPCRRCGTRIRSALLGDPPRRTAWCPQCQPDP